MELWVSIEYRSDDITKKTFFLDFSVLDTMEHDEKHPQPKLGANWFNGSMGGGGEIWPHKHLISPIEISVNWSGSKQL